ncbi:MAG: hypothetical protein COA79_13890 [Planctomycetota bacterium]|nr:MAG: hypothetical protein COA79_13890 [Planctomycetota bacterium]
MEEGVPDVWNPTGGNKIKGSSMIIPLTDLPDSNIYFGNLFGLVNVTCKDGEDNVHFTESEGDIVPNKRLSVFFSISDSKNGVPTWFYYWKEVIMPFGEISSLNYDASTSNYGYRILF